MARLWQSGFELNSSTSGVEWDTCTNVTVQTSTVRSGTYAGKVTSPVQFVGRFFKQQFKSANSNGPFFARAYVNFGVLPNAETSIMAFFESGGTQPIDVTVDGSGNVRLYYNDLATVIGTSSTVVTTGTWYRFEIKIDKSGSAGSHIAELKIDGAGTVTASNLTITNGVEILALGINLQGDGDTASTIYFDDVAINDNTGSFQTGYPGSGKIIHQKPNGDGDNHQWATAVGGTAGASNNYTRVNETTPDDATSYNSDSTVGHLDDYTVGASGIGSSDTVNVVAVGVRYASVSASNNSSFVVRLKAVTGGTVSEGSTITPNATSYKTNANSAPKNFTLVSYQKPGTSNAWTQSDLDAAQIGLHLTANNTNNDRVSTLFMSVDYTPATVTTQTITGKARITATTTQTITGKSRITATTTQTTTGKARITQITNQTITGKSRITDITNQTITGKSRITNTTVQTITGKSRIQVTTTQTITGKARMTIGTNQTITGKARVTATTIQNITGVGNIKNTTNQTITGKGRIQITSTQTLNGVARIIISTTQTITGKARITNATAQTITGKARIQTVVPKTITGLSRITNATRQTITGKAKITANVINVNYQVSASIDDARNISGNGTFNNTAVAQHLGKFSTTDYWNGWRWLSVAVPQGAIIDNAYIDLYAANIEAGTNALIVLYGDAEDTATPFANDTANKPELKPRTNASTTHTFTNANWATTGFGIEQIDVTALVQEIVNRTGWSSGNNLAIMAHDNGSATNTYVGYSTYDSNTARGAKLYISYHTISATQQNINGVARITNKTLQTLQGKANIVHSNTWAAYIMGWIYPTEGRALADMEDGRVLHFVKPEWFTLDQAGHLGQLYQLQVANGDGVNAFSASNLAAVKQYAKYQFITVSSNLANFVSFLANTSIRNTAITTLVNFCVTNGVTGIELDWEGFGQWTSANLAAYKSFLTDLGTALHQQGKKLMITLPPIGDNTMAGYYVFGYPEFVSYPVDYFVVMAYDYEYDYGAGTSVSPNTWVQNICNWALSNTTGFGGASRLVIGMPSYGYYGTTGQYVINIITKTQAQARTGYNTATRNADHEMNWTTGGVYNNYQDTTGLNAKRTLIEATGIQYISVWHLGDNDWFTGTELSFTITTTQPINGTARITVSTQQTITGKASIFKTTNRAIQGLARIQKVVNQTITGKGRIQRTSSQTITGIARIVIASITTTPRTITGVANIKNTTKKTITGKAAIKAPTQQNITGVARITAPSNTVFEIDNNILSDGNRQSYIGAIYTQLAGLTYFPFSADDGGLGFYELGDRIIVEDTNNEQFEVVILSMDLTINTGVQETISSPVPQATTPPYAYAGYIGKKIRNVQVIVDKQNGQIQLINDNLTTNYYTQNETIAQITIQTASIVQSVQDVTTLAQSAKTLAETNQSNIQTIQSNITSIEQTATQIGIQVQTVGGTNLLKNSVGLKGDVTEWQLFDNNGALIDPTNTAVIDQSPNTQANTESGSALIISDQYITQTVNTIVGQTYTLYLRFNKVGNAYITLTGAGTIPLTIPEYVDGTWKLFTYSFTATAALTTLELSNTDPGASAILSDILLKLGSATGWSQAPNEVYGKNFSFDKNGFNLTDPNSKFKAVLNNTSLTVYDTSSGSPQIVMEVSISAGIIRQLIAQDEFIVQRYGNPASSMHMIPQPDGVYIVINN